MPSPTPARRGRAALVLALFFVVAAAVVLVAYLALQSRLAPQTPGGSAAQEAPGDQVLRERAAGYFAKDERAAALRELKPLVERPNPRADDLVSAAVVAMRTADYETARRYLQQAQALEPDSPRVHYNQGRLAHDEGEFESAREHLEQAVKAAPEDVPTKLLLAAVLESSDPQRSESLYRDVARLGVDALGSWYLTTIFQLASLYRVQGREQEQLALLREFEELRDRGLKAPSEAESSAGNFGRILPPPPRSGPGPELGPPPSFGPPRTSVPELANAELAVTDAENDGRMDLLGWSAKGVALALNGAAGWSAAALGAQPTAFALAVDLSNDDDMDVLAIESAGALVLFEAERDGATGALAWTRSGAVLPEFSGGRDALWVDYDHDGDLDLLAVGSSGVRLLRNDGLGSKKPGGELVDVTAQAGLPRERAFEWCLIEDFDTDQDVDFLLGGALGAYLASNLRGGKFEDASARLAGRLATSAKPIVADLDHDARPDLWDPAHPDSVYLGQPSGAFLTAASHVPSSGHRPWSEALLADADLDGFFDALAWALPDDSNELKLDLARAIGWPAKTPNLSALELGRVASTGRRAVAFDDFDGDLQPDLALSTPQGIEIRPGVGPFGKLVRLGFRGKKDNRRAVGAIVELRAGDRYQRHYWLGEARLVGVGAASTVQWRRVTWPNGVVQWDLSPDLGDRTIQKEAFGGLEQSEGLMGSCPFLYTWNGERNVFISDVLGITPLGLSMAPGMLVPPDHDEYVLVRGDQLAPRDGFFEVHFTEELREVTYLDRIRLDAVDHPAGTEIFPNELFRFPPFPEAHVHSVRGALAPLSARGSDGGDWTAALARTDDEYAAPFELAPSQFLGLATPHFLELAFDRDALRAAPKLRLVMTGWFYWTDASVNMAAAGDPEHDFVPPILQVPDGQGGWRDAGPPLGFPAGKTKTMVVDVTAMLDREDPRLRLFSTLRLYWDSIRLAVDGDDAELATISLEPSSAILWRRGFSAPEKPEKPYQPERFEWSRLADMPRWNPHPGLYTKYGESLPLVTAIDDRFVVMASGDALTVRFDASGLPPLAPGFVRDYLVFLDGWAKDRDPNTLEALYVEPLPFHGMSGYPYGPTEHFPDGPEHRAWRREWLVRPAEDWQPRLGADIDQRPSFPNASIAPRN